VTKATALIAHGSGLTLRVVDAGAATARRNAAVTRIEVTPDAGGAPREYAIEAEVTNHSERPLSGVEVGLEVDGAERSRARLDVPAHGSAVQRFHQRFAEEGVHRGLVRLAADRLPDDDVRHFAVEVRESLQTLVINGEPRPGSYHDETFYLQRALTTAVPGEPSIRPVVIDAETARSTTLTGHDAVILAGLTKIDLALAGRLADWVMEGGGLLVSAGGQTAPDWGALESVLPARVRGLAGRPRGERARGLAGVLRSHPLFAAYGNGPTGLEATRVQMHLLVEPDPKAERRILSELEGGFPLILERQVRSGRVLLLTTSLDRDWTDLPIRPGYLPLVQRAVRYLADSLDAQGPRRIEIGDAVPLEVSPGMLRLVVRPPDGQDVEFSANDLAGRNRISFSATGRPGPYRVWVETPGFGGLREVPALDFVAELAPDESDPTRRALPATPGTASMAGATGRLPLWSWFLLAAFVLVVVESFLAGLGLRRSHLEQGVARLLAASLGWGRAGLGSLERFGHRRFSFSPRPGPSRRS